MAKSELEKILENCWFAFKGNVFSTEKIINRYIHFLSNTMSIAPERTERHKTAIVMHTGSECFDATVIICAAIMCIIKSSQRKNDVLDSLNEGDLVLYNNSKYRYIGVTSEKVGMEVKKYIVLEKKDKHKTKCSIPIDRSNLLVRYMGTSQTTDDRGLSSTNTLRNAFITDVLGIPKSNIPSVVNDSVVLVMQRQKAEELFRNISFCYKSTGIPLSDLITATYYTENAEQQIGSNLSKNEAVLQITSDTSIARELVRNRRTENNKLGVIICGNDIAERNESDISDLLSRKNLSFGILSLDNNTNLASSLLEEYHDERFFLCTKDFLLTYCDMNTGANNELTCELQSQVDNVIDGSVTFVSADNMLEWNTYVRMKQLIYFISQSDYDSTEKDNFVVYAYSALNLLTTAVFSMGDMNIAVIDWNIRISSCGDRLEELERNIKTFPDSIRLLAGEVLNNLETLYFKLFDECPKAEWLKDFLNNHINQTTAIIVPRKYYQTIMEYHGYFAGFDEDKLVVSTANTFDYSRKYDHIISIGLLSGKRFYPFRCNCSADIIILASEFQSKLYLRKKMENESFIKALNDHSTLPVQTDYEPPVLTQSECEEIAELENIQTETESHIDILKRKYLACEMNWNSQPNTPFVEALRIAKLDNGEVVYFTKRYKAYVYNETEGQISEVEADKLSEGDTLLFTENDSDTKDIVDMVLKNRISSGKYVGDIPQYYEMSKRWKSVLREYKTVHGFSSAEISKRLNASVEEGTIRNWLDEDSHIIGPQKIENMLNIAMLCEDNELFDNAEAYFQACKEIRAVRRGILREIGQVLRNKVIGIKPEKFSEAWDIYNRLGKQITIVSVEYISECSRQVPVNYANKPINSRMEVKS